MAENPVQSPVDKMAGNSLDHRAGEPSPPSVSKSNIDASFQKNLQKMSMDVPQALQAALSPVGQRPAAKKSSFQITRVITKNDDVDADDLDETNTEDMSSDLLDISKTTESGAIEPDPSSEDTVEMAPEAEELQNTKEINHRPPIQAQQFDDSVQLDEKEKVNDGQSRFKVVKIESKEPFRRGRWTCLDFLDPPSEKLTEKTSEENFVGSGNSSAASSVHYIPGVDDPSKNPLSTSTTYIDDYTNNIVEPQPVYPGNYQPQSQQLTNGLSADFSSSAPPHTSTPNLPHFDSQTSSSIGAGPSQPGQSSAAPPTETLPSSISSQPPGSSQQSMPSQPPSQSHVLSTQVPTTNHIPPPTSLPGELSSQQLPSTNFESSKQSQNATVPQTSQQETSDFNQQTASQPQSITQTPLQNKDFESYQPGSSSQTNLKPTVGAAPSQTSVNPPQSATSGELVQSPVQVSQTGSGVPSKNASPNEENVQGTDFLTQDRGYATGPAIPEEKPEVVPVESRRDINLLKTTAGLTPPLFEMVSATMHPPITAKDDDER